MDNQFEILIVYKEKELLFIGTLITYGYAYKIEVEINGEKVFFERDDENNFRALSDYENPNTLKVMDVLLLQLLSEKIYQLLT